MLAKCLLAKADVKEVRIFYSYAHEDASYRTSIDEVLGRFKWDVSVRAWYDGEIRPGSEWAHDIDRHLDAADIILLFVTQGFVDSHYCMNIELPRALLQHERKKARVIPILLEPTTPSWSALPFRHLQVLPPGGVPLSQWPDRPQALRDSIHAIVNEITEPLLEASDRTRWKLYLDAELTRFSFGDEAEVVGALRDLSHDSTLRTRGAATTGSVVVDIDSTREGLAQIRNWFNAGNRGLRQVAAFRVLRIIEWYGAAVHAATAIGMPPPPDLPGPGNMQFPTEPGEAAVIKGMTIDAKNPLESMDFIIDTGNLPDDQSLQEDRAERMLEDFLTCLATPESDMWVNLSPNENAKLLGVTLQGTRVGRAMLEMDVLLKRLASSLLHPDHEVGMRYWQRVFRETAEVTGHIDHTYHTYPRVWLIPEKATVWVREDGKTSGSSNDDDVQLPDWLRKPLPPGHQQAFVIESEVKAMCEQDYFAAKSSDSTPMSPVDQVCHNAFIEIVLPIIEKEVNSGRAFAGFRAFNKTLILATWMKNCFRDNPLIKRFIDSGNVRQLTPAIKGITPLHVNVEKSSRNVDGRKSALEFEPVEQDSVDSYSQLLEEGVRLREISELPRSKTVLEKVLEHRLNIYGERHYLSHVAMSQLGRTLLVMNDLEQATQLHRRVLRLSREMLGERHPHTVNSMRLLSQTLTAAGQMAEGAQLTADAAAIDVMLKPEYEDPDNRDFYEQYLQIYRHGVFFVRRHEFDATSGQRVTRAYFSGAIDMRSLNVITKKGRCFQ